MRFRMNSQRHGMLDGIKLLVVMSMIGMTDLTSLNDRARVVRLIAKSIRTSSSRCCRLKDREERLRRIEIMKIGIAGANNGTSLRSNRSSSSMSSSVLSPRLSFTRSEATRLRRRSGPRSPGKLGAMMARNSHLGSDSADGMSTVEEDDIAFDSGNASCQNEEVIISP
jgi:hypothetical protein